jgi:3-oxoacyl-[acyl-carrier-protein] synthase-1
MKPVYLAGRGLTCALGLDVEGSLQALRRNSPTTSFRNLPGNMGGRYPYFAIPSHHDDWNQRAQNLVQRVATEAGAQQIRSGTMIIATSSFDIGAKDRVAAQMNYSAFSNQIASWLNWQGSVYVINTACTSGLNALFAAQALLRNGDADDVLVLGIELDNLVTLGGFAALQLLSPDSSKPFAVNRNGLVLGEAVAALRLSTHEQAGWKILGGANVVDGSQPTGASAQAVASMYQRALSASQLEAAAIDLIKVQAAGSPGNDMVEAQGLRSAFPVVPPLLSLKSAMGHTMGASGVAEIALLTACVEQGVSPSYTDGIDADLGVELATQMPQDVRRIMATILGFGGSHASVVLERA